MKREDKIKQAATLARAEKEGLMASSFSKLNSEIRRAADSADEEEGRLPTMGKRSRKEKDNEFNEKREAEKKERDEIRRLLRKENERNRRRE